MNQNTSDKSNSSNPMTSNPSQEKHSQPSREGFIDQALRILEGIHAQDLQNLESFLNSLSQRLDKTILQIEKNEGLTYQAGSGVLKITQNSANKMHFEANLYFQNNQGQWLQKTCSEPNMIMEVYLDDDSIRKLKEIQEYKFSVSHP